MEPTSDMATTVYSPRLRAAMARIISTTLPKVAFSSPPIVSPNLQTCQHKWIQLSIQGGDAMGRSTAWSRLLSPAPGCCSMLPT